MIENSGPGGPGRLTEEEFARVMAMLRHEPVRYDVTDDPDDEDPPDALRQ